MPSLAQINSSLLTKAGGKAKEYDFLLDGYKDNLISAYKKSADDITNEIAKLYANISGKPTLGQVTRFKRLDKLFENIDARLKNLGVEELKIDTVAIKGAFESSYYYTAYSMETSFGGVKMGFTIIPERAIQASLTNPLSKIKWQSSIKTNINTLNNQVRQQITEGLIKGESYNKTAKAVHNTIINKTGVKQYKGAVTKAFRIVRTETHRAFSTGSDLAFNKANRAAGGLGLKPLIKIWISSLDSLTRKDHQSADGTESNKNGQFELFGAVFDSPSNSGLAEQDINCRCVYSVKVQGLTNKKRFDNIAKKAIPKTTYNEWLSNKKAA